MDREGILPYRGCVARARQIDQPDKNEGRAEGIADDNSSNHPAIQISPGKRRSRKQLVEVGFATVIAGCPALSRFSGPYGGE